MRNRVIPPRIQLLIWLLVTVVSVAMIWTGAADMNRLGRETPSTISRIAFGIIGAVFGMVFVVLSCKAMQVMRRARTHKGEIARWTVSPGDLDAFRENDRAHSKAGRRNDLRIPRSSPQEGLEVIFLDDNVIVGGRIFGLVTTGMYRFSSIQVLPERPLAIELDLTLTTLATGASGVHVFRSARGLRIPVATLARAEAVKVFEHFRAVAAREVIVNPDFYGKRIRFAFWWLIVSLGCAAAGFAMNRPHMSPDEVVVPLTLAVAGSVCAVGAGVLMFLAWSLRRDQLGAARQAHPGRGLRR